MQPVIACSKQCLLVALLHLMVMVAGRPSVRCKVDHLRTLLQVLVHTPEMTPLLMEMLNSPDEDAAKTTLAYLVIAADSHSLDITSCPGDGLVKMLSQEEAMQVSAAKTVRYLARTEGNQLYLITQTNLLTALIDLLAPPNPAPLQTAAAYALHNLAIPSGSSRTLVGLLRGTIMDFASNLVTSDQPEEVQRAGLMLLRQLARCTEGGQYIVTQPTVMLELHRFLTSDVTSGLQELAAIALANATIPERNAIALAGQQRMLLALAALLNDSSESSCQQEAAVVFMNLTCKPVCQQRVCQVPEVLAALTHGVRDRCTGPVDAIGNLARDSQHRHMLANLPGLLDSLMRNCQSRLSRLQLRHQQQPWAICVATVREEPGCA